MNNLSSILTALQKQYELEMHLQKPEEIISKIEELHPLLEVFQPKVLYVGNLTDIPTNIPPPQDFTVNIIVFPEEGEDASPDLFPSSPSNLIIGREPDKKLDLIRELRRMIVPDYLRKYYSEVFLKALLADRGLFGILHAASELLNNPVMLMDDLYNLLAYASKTSDVNNFEWQNNIRMGKCSDDLIDSWESEGIFSKVVDSSSPFLMTTGKGSSRWISGKVIIQQTIIGHIGVLEYDKPIDEQDIPIVDLMCRVLAVEMKKNQRYKNLSGLFSENVMIQLLEGRITDVQLLEQRTKNLSWNLHSSFALGILRSESSSQQYKILPSIIIDRVHALFPSIKTIRYHDDYISLIECSREEYDRFHTRVDLPDFLKKNRMRGIFSPFYKDITRTSQVYQQTLTALQLALHLNPDQLLYNAGDYIFYEFIRGYIDTFGDENVRHPILHRLADYDEENGSNYCETLMAYIRSGKNKSSAAQRLFIHRNTLEYRLKKISQLTDIDYEDEDTLGRLLVSWEMLKFYRQQEL